MEKIQQIEKHIKDVHDICNHALDVLGVKDLRFRPMIRTKPIDTKKSFVIGRTNMKTGLITIDVLTPIKRESKKISSVLRILCHEVAHHQKPPYKQFHKFRWINRQHYPKFYKQVTKNINKLKKDKDLKIYF